jgi:hypothetical protein
MLGVARSCVDRETIVRGNSVLSENNRKAELSYACLHAVAAAAGFACGPTHRHLDASSVDAQVDVRERLDPNATLTDFSLQFQLKATSATLPLIDGRLSYALDVSQYDKLRSTAVSIPRIVVLMVLPGDSEDWLSVSAEELVARHCARWASLYGAPKTANTSTATVRFSVDRLLTPRALREIARRVAIGEDILHDS